MRSFTGLEGGNLFEGVGGSVFEGFHGNVFEGHRGFADIFGFGQAADALSALNLETAKAALAKLDEYRLYKKIIPRLDVATREKAISIVKDKWYPPSLLGIIPRGKLDLDELEARVQTYANTKTFYVIKPDLSISKTNYEKYMAFRQGLHALREVMKPFRGLFDPTERVRIESYTVERNAEPLLSRARAAAVSARSSRSPVDIGGARALAEAAKEAATNEGRTDIVVEAEGLIAEMDSLAQRAGVPQAGKTTDIEAAGLGTTGIVLIAAGGLAVVGAILYLVTRK